MRSIQVVARARAAGPGPHRPGDLRAPPRSPNWPRSPVRRPGARARRARGRRRRPAAAAAGRAVSCWSTGRHTPGSPGDGARPADGIDPIGLAATLDAVLDRHDLLRAQLVTGDDGRRGTRDRPAGRHVRGRADPPGRDGRRPRRAAAIESCGRSSTPRRAGWTRPRAYSPVRVVRPRTRAARPAAVVVHHLVVDGVSWRILMSDFAEAWHRLRLGRRPELPAVGTSARRWAQALRGRGDSPRAGGGTGVLAATVQGPDPPLGDRPLDPAVDVMSTVDTCGSTLPAESPKRC